MQRLDEAIVAFANDMKAKGRWNDVVVVVISEFGRRNYENGSIGTDHGWGHNTLVLGGGVKGQFLSATSGYTTEVVEADLADGSYDYLPFATDFRDIYGHIVQNHLGLDAIPLFPDPAYVPAFGSLDII